MSQPEPDPAWVRKLRNHQNKIPWFFSLGHEGPVFGCRSDCCALSLSFPPLPLLFHNRTQQEEQQASYYGRRYVVHSAPLSLCLHACVHMCISGYACGCVCGCTSCALHCICWLPLSRSCELAVVRNAEFVTILKSWRLFVWHGVSWHASLSLHIHSPQCLRVALARVHACVFDTLFADWLLWIFFQF